MMRVPTLIRSEAATAGPAVAADGRAIKEPAGDRIFLILIYFLLAVLTISVVYPLIFVVSSSFSSGRAISAGDVVLWPVEPNLDAYKTIFNSPALIIGFRNSIFYAVAGGLVGTALTMLAGYALSRRDLPFQRSLTLFFLIPTLFSAGIIPTYIVVRQLNLIDSVWAIVLPGAMNVFNVLITRTFYQMNVPEEMLEAARVDGASDFRFFFQVALPLSKPIIAVNLLFYAIAQWNGWFSAFLYLSNQDLYPLQLVLRDLLAQSAVDPSQIGGGADLRELVRRKELFDKLKFAMIVIAMIPPIIAYPFVQRHFVKGALIGSLK